jgi:hypothetical protein
LIFACQNSGILNSKKVKKWNSRTFVVDVFIRYISRNNIFLDETANIDRNFRTLNYGREGASGELCNKIGFVNVFEVEAFGDNICALAATSW